MFCANKEVNTYIEVVIICEDNQAFMVISMKWSISDDTFSGYRFQSIIM